MKGKANRNLPRLLPKQQLSWSQCAQDRESFISFVYAQAQQLYRDLPWRNCSDPYAVLVSECMLQQTQVSRVLRYWERWMEAFPCVDALAMADARLVLEAWQGLGYNRRALSLKKACEQCSRDMQGKLPLSVEDLMLLPGVGPATAAGVVAFAYNKPAVYIETNVRSVFLHQLFPNREGVSDKELVPYVEDSCPKDNPRGWYYALLDLGADMKKQGINPARRSKHYAKQSAFEGSFRQKRSFVLKYVLACEDMCKVGDVRAALDEHERKSGRDAVSAEEFARIISALVKDGFLQEDALLGHSMQAAQ